MDQVQTAFYDNVVTPWRELDALLSKDPIAANPSSNFVIFKVHALVLSLNHFREKNTQTPVVTVKISDDLRNFANSIKHAKGGETRVACWLAPQYECCDGKFRFIRNEVVCKYDEARGTNKDRVFVATVEIWTAIRNYASALCLDINRFAPTESLHGFLPVAIAFHRPSLAAYTKEARLSVVKKVGQEYEHFDPASVTFVVLDEEAIGQDLATMDWSFAHAPT